jgi:signal transduction histidine kinase
LRTHAQSHDVIGKLAGALNNMAVQLGDLTGNMSLRISSAITELKERNTALREKTDQLEESNKKLQELDHLKSDFVSMVSHELRTPLTSIIGFSKTLQILTLPPEQQKSYLNIIESEGKRLANLVEEYLDISKIESGFISLKRMRLDPGRLLSEIAGTYLVQKNVRIVTHISEALPRIQADPDRLKQVIINFIDNAVRYSPDGGVVTVNAQMRDTDMVVRVSDQGPGIKPEDRDKIFTKFYQGKDEIARKSKGSGLGLAIAKGIIDAHNGRIWFEPNPCQGAVFCFSLSAETSVVSTPV